MFKIKWLRFTDGLYNRPLYCFLRIKIKKPIFKPVHVSYDKVVFWSLTNLARTCIRGFRPAISTNYQRNE